MLSSGILHLCVQYSIQVNPFHKNVRKYNWYKRFYNFKINFSEEIYENEELNLPSLKNLINK